MEEKVLIESKKSRVVTRITSLGIIMMVCSVLLRIVFPRRWFAEKIASGNRHDLVLDFLDTLAIPSDGYEYVFSGLLYIGFIFLLVGLIMSFAYKKVSLTVTDKRVYGTSAWGKRVDLPLDMIAAVATSFLGGIAVSSASGAIRFFNISNNGEIHETISKLLMERQENNKTPEQTHKDSEPKTKAEELREMGELLKEGLITQEEFDAKKKQLLGL